MIVLAMGSAVALGGRELLVAEAAVSAILIATLARRGRRLPAATASSRRSSAAASRSRSACLLFPPDPALLVGRALNRLFADLGRALGDVADALEHGDPEVAERAQERGQALDLHMIAIRQEQLELRETARFAPPRRRARGQLARIERSMGAIDYAARDTVVLARNALRFLRSGAVAPAAADRGGPRARRRGLGARRRLRRRPARRARSARSRWTRPRQASGLAEDARDLRLAELVVQVRSVAVDLVRAGRPRRAAWRRRPARTSCSRSLRVAHGR